MNHQKVSSAYIIFDTKEELIAYHKSEISRLQKELLAEHKSRIMSCVKHLSADDKLDLISFLQDEV